MRITPPIAEILEELGSEVGKLFPWTPDGVSHHFMRTARRANLKVRLHDPRHTFASHLLMSGVDVVGEIIGHKDLKATQIYAHLSQSYLDEAVLRLDFADKTQTED